MLTKKGKKFVLDTILMQITISGEFAARMTALPYLSTGDLTDDDIDTILDAIAEENSKVEAEEAAANSNVNSETN